MAAASRPGSGIIPSMNRTDAAIGVILGTAVGDALGLPCEGLSRRRQQKWFPELDSYHLLFGRGLCSDDTEHTCLLAQSLIASGGEPNAFRRTFAWRLRWWFVGLPAGIGLATLRSICKLWLFVPAAWQGVYSAGNAPAMRSALLGVCFADDDAALVALNRIACRMTHTDPKAECGALAIALAARCSMNGTSSENYLQILSRLMEPHGAAGVELLTLVGRAHASASSGQATYAFMAELGCAAGVSGYMYVSVPAVLHAWFSHPNDYARALAAVIRCGGDTDTMGAMVGAIVGAGVGRAGIPQQWLDRLAEWPRTVDWMEQLGQRVAEATVAHVPMRPVPLSLPALVVRNAAFILLVLAHGVRRLLPPY